MSGEDDNPGFSPPTSPARISPATSPVRSVSPASPQTSTYARSESQSTSSGSPSPTAANRKRGPKRTLTRTALQRKRRKLLCEEDEEGAEEEQEDEEEDNEEEDYENQEESQEETLCVDNQQQREIPQEQANADEQEVDSSSNSESETSSVSDEGSSSNGSEHVSFRSESSGCESNDSSAGGSDSDGALSQSTVISLFTGSGMSANQALFNVLKLSVEECWTKTSLDKNIKMIKKMLPEPNEFPSSSKDALKRLEKLTSPCSESEFLYCDNCLQLVETENESCEHLGSHGKFFTFPVEEQIRHMFEQRGLASVIDSYREHPSKKLGHICDICDGSEYKRVKLLLPNSYDLVLLWNTDGVALSSSSKQELWPVLCTISEVPPRLRSSFIIVAGVYVGGKDPDMNVYLKPISAALQKLFESGFAWVHPVSKQNFITKVIAPCLCADAPAKAKVLQHKNHNSRYGCTICEQKSKKIERPPTERYNANGKRKPRLRRFVFQDDEGAARIRTKERLDSLAVLAEERGKPRKGVICKSIISDFPHLDRATTTCAEYLHQILLGVVKYFLIKIFEESGPWSINKFLEEINIFISEDIKVPDFINRLPRKTKDFKYWKASELLAFLLFYSLPLFKGKLPDQYFQHWLLLVGAIYILLKEAISDDDLMAADVMLRLFVRDIGDLYGEKCYTYNVHNLLHLTLLVRRWGPIWATSAFLFETCNGYLGQHVHGTKNLGQELINNIKISQSVAVLENILNAPPADDYHNFKSRQLGIELLGKPLQRSILNTDEITAIDSSNLGTYMLYKRAKIVTNIYTTQIYDSNKKRANSYVQFKDETEQTRYGQILVFINKSANSEVFCLVKIFKIVHVNLFYHQLTSHVIRHLFPVQETDRILVIPVECVIQKVLKVGMYIGIRPNSYELNL